MKVRFKALSAGPNGVIRPGDVVDVSRNEAMMLVDCGYAEALEPLVTETENAPNDDNGQEDCPPDAAEAAEPKRKAGTKRKG